MISSEQRWFKNMSIVNANIAVAVQYGGNLILNFQTHVILNWRGGGGQQHCFSRLQSRTKTHCMKVWFCH